MPKKATAEEMMEWYDLHVIPLPDQRYAVGRPDPGGFLVTDFCDSPRTALEYLERHQTAIRQAMGWE